jgi:hypothetical protein
MATKQVKPKIKPIDRSCKLYHHFEYSVSEFGLFDDADDGTPVVVGSRNLVDATIRHLPKSVTIFYYKKHSKGYWEKKMVYEGKQEDLVPMPQIEKET